MEGFNLQRNNDANFLPTVKNLNKRWQKLNEGRTCTKQLAINLTQCYRQSSTYNTNSSKLFQEAIKRPKVINQSLLKSHMTANIADIKKQLINDKQEQGLVLDLRDEYLKEVENGLTNIQFEVDQFL